MNLAAKTKTSIASSVNRAVVGLGATGLSTMRHLRKVGHTFVAYDQKRPEADVAFWQQIDGLVAEEDIAFAQEGLSILSLADVIYLSPGIAPDAKWLQDHIKAGTTISGDLDLFANAAKAPVIAITGSNAKSTVTTLVGEMAEACGIKVAVGGNLGTPMLDLLDDEVELYVLELSSFQLERSEGLQGHIACILNLSSDHLDRHGSMAVYHAQKQRIYRGAAHAVTNRDDALTAPLSRQGLAEHSFGLSEPFPGQFGFEIQDGKRLAKYGQEFLFDASKVNLLGEHNLLNALAAVAIGYVAGFSVDAMRKTLYNFRGLPHRTEFVAEISGVRFVNDSKATNVGSACAAIKGISEALENATITLIAGGVSKGADLQPLVDCCREQSVKLILIGESAAEFIALAAVSTDSDKPLDLCTAPDLSQAVNQAYRQSNSGDVVLLAPACASFDMFDNYRHRGDCFKQAVRIIQQSSGVVDG